MILQPYRLWKYAVNLVVVVNFSIYADINRSNGCRTNMKVEKLSCMSRLSCFGIWDIVRMPRLCRKTSWWTGGFVLSEPARRANRSFQLEQATLGMAQYTTRWWRSTRRKGNVRWGGSPDDVFPQTCRRRWWRSFCVGGTTVGPGFQGKSGIEKKSWWIVICQTYHIQSIPHENRDLLRCQLHWCQPGLPTFMTIFGAVNDKLVS